MSEAQDKEAKTEDATEKRLIDAKAKGQVAFSREIPIVASTLAIWAALSPRWTCCSTLPSPKPSAM